jgi:hypothetical protein
MVALKKTASYDCPSCIKRYFVPYFGEKRLEQLTHTDVREFELWCDGFFFGVMPLDIFFMGISI